MKSPKIMYILISLFCVFALMAGIYEEFIVGKTSSTKDNNLNENLVVEKDAQTIKAELNDLFTNTINLNGYDTTIINKLDSAQEIIYTYYDLAKSEEWYELNIKVPVVNIKGEVASSFNAITQEKFLNKASEILANTESTTSSIYTIDYVSFINDGILSVVIRATLKEGDNPQSIRMQTYNYNLSTNQSVTLNELITHKVINREDVTKAINKIVTEADEMSKVYQNMGYSDIYIRDLNSSMYTIEGTTTYFLGPNNELYIIYPYGNDNATSEMDIVLFE